MAAHLHLKVFILSGQRDGPPAAECNEALFYLFCQSNALLFNAAAIEVAKVASKHLFHAIQQPFYPTFMLFQSRCRLGPAAVVACHIATKKKKMLFCRCCRPMVIFFY